MGSPRVEWGNEALTCHAGGLRWERAGVTRDETWDRVLGIAMLDVTAKIQGFPIGRWLHLTIELVDHTWIKIVSRNLATLECMACVRQYATPVIVKRLAAELQAGREVLFGPVALTTASLRVKRKSWPLAHIAGYRTYQGTWMVDVGPREAPALKASVPLLTFVNYDAFRVLLEQLRPGLDYGPDPADLGTVFRPSASSHDPRYLSGRGRLMILGGLVGAGMIAGSVVLAMQAVSRHGFMQERQKKIEAANVLFNELRGVAAAETAPWTCDGPLVAGTDSGELVGAIGAAPGATGVPSDLPVVLESGSVGLLLVDGVTMDRARYVLLGEVLSVTVGKRDMPGVVRIALRVTDRTANKVVCRGLYEAPLAPAYGSDEGRRADIALQLALKNASVHAVCAAGGPRLCRSVEVAIAKPEPVLEAPRAVPTKKKRKR